MRRGRFRCAFCGRVFDRRYQCHRCSDGQVTKNFRKKEKKARLLGCFGTLLEFEKGELFNVDITGVEREVSQICLYEFVAGFGSSLRFGFYGGSREFGMNIEIPFGLVVIVEEQVVL